MKPIRIANVHGFWGDRIDAASELLSQDPTIDYLTLDFLAELSLSIMAIQRQKDPEGGYAKDFVDVVRSLIPFWKKGSKVKVITNAGGLNPLGCAKACAKVLEKQCGRPFKIAVVSGDNVLSELREQPENPHYQNLDTQASLETVLASLNTANVYLGAESLVKALQQDVDIVITGRVTDPSLTVAPCVAHFGWSWHDYDLLASATIAGHLIECGTQVTGGISTHWLQQVHDVDLGYPIVEISTDGTFFITKSTQSKGIVNEETVKEQLLYEIGDPQAFLGPDVTTSFTSLSLTSKNPNQIFIRGAKGTPPPALLKVSASYEAGYKAEAFLTIVGRDAEKKSALCAESVLNRLIRKQQEPRTFYYERLGQGDASLKVLHHPLHGELKPPCIECVLRLAVEDPKKEVVEFFIKEIAPLVTAGPQGTTGYTSGRPHVRPVFGYWPCLIERKNVHPKVEFLEVQT